MSAIEVRAATEADAAAIGPLHSDSVRRLDGPYYLPEQIEAWAGGPKSPEQYIQGMRSGEKMYVAIKDGQLVGWGCLGGHELRALYVSPDHVRRGIGTLLCDALEAWAVGQGHTALRLSSSLQAEAFYRKRGYLNLGPTTYRLKALVDLEAVKMEKRLSPAGDQA